MVTAGLGGMGGAQPLAVTMNGGCALCVEVDLQRIERRIETGYLDERAADLDDALRRLDASTRAARGAVHRAVRQRRRGAPSSSPRRGGRRRHRSDERPRPAQRLRPAGLSVEQADALRVADPDDYLRRVGESVVARGAIRLLQEAGAEAFDYGNALRGLAAAHGASDAFAYPGFVPAYIRPLFCEGKGPFRWVGALGGPGRHPRHRRGDPRPLRRPGAHRALDRPGARARPLPGTAARICWLGYGERDRAGLRFNEMVASGELRAPVVIGRDHLDAGSVASPQRETESMLDGSDAVADWPLLDALRQRRLRRLVGLHPPRRRRRDGLSIHAGQVCVADGTRRAASASAAS